MKFLALRASIFIQISSSSGLEYSGSVAEPPPSDPNPVAPGSAAEPFPLCLESVFAPPGSAAEPFPLVRKMSPQNLSIGAAGIPRYMFLCQIMWQRST